ncbi:MAG: SDR family oxidoreductase [Burkholderiales bacterium]|nr:SDR family oxidoreductase [Burkholderiales bacterium]
MNDLPSIHVALVTGAARGLGRAISERLAREGHPVVLADLDPEVENTARTLRESGAQARAVCLDIADEAAVATLPQRLGDWWQRLAILVNNAGISPKHEGRKREVADMSLQEWRRVIDVNLTGAFLVTRQCIPALKAHGWGRVVMITSQAARTRTPVPGAHYQASKSGLTGLARVLAAELAPFGVTVNCVAPGRVESEMTRAVGGEVNAQLAAVIPAGRLGRPEEVAAAVAYFVARDAGYCTGAVLDVNGGNFMA